MEPGSDDRIADRKNARIPDDFCERRSSKFLPDQGNIVQWTVSPKLDVASEWPVLQNISVYQPDPSKYKRVPSSRPRCGGSLIHA